MGASFDDALSDVAGEPALDADGRRRHRAEAHFAAAVAALESLGFTSAVRKEQRPARRITALGVDIDLDTRRVKLTDSKRRKYAERTREILAEATVEREALLSLLGRMGFAASFYPRGR